VSAGRVDPAARLHGAPAIPGDKSISHRAAILGALADGETHLTDFLTAADCLNTLQACAQLGAKVRRQGTEVWIIGCGLHGLQRPAGAIDCGNSGTGTRLLAGMLAGQPFDSVITGDAQVRRRPMQRIIDPLTQMGATIESEPGGLCPLRIRGGALQGIDYLSPVASAQVKSCVLLAGLWAQGTTWVTEPTRSRNHTELLLRYFGAAVTKPEIVRWRPDAGRGSAWGTRVGVTGGTPLQARNLEIPSDPSSAAFFIVAASLLPGSDLLVKNVGLNPTRSGLIQVLRLAGADITSEARRQLAGEPVADLRVKGVSALRPLQITSPALIPLLIDELPILAVAAARAAGTSVIRNAAELRVKETDRIQVLAQEFRRLGVDIEPLPDGLVIHGGAVRGGEADSHGDHRLAMSLAVLGLVSEQGVVVNGTDCTQTSFPGFWERLAEVRA
jgi:3-phosphoshikimate 1-carboxyvinyltransferase